MLSGWASEYSTRVSSRLLKLFMGYHGNKICPDERMDKRGERTARKHNAFADKSINIAEKALNIAKNCDMVPTG